jgi:single-strand DNA-binding protein
VGENVVANLSLAFDYYDPKAEKKRSTTWIDGALWGKQATSLEQYLTKGSQVCVTIDDLHLETYQGKNGEGTKLVGRVTSIRLAGGRAEGPAASHAPAPLQAPAAAPRPRAPAPDIDDGDIPF